MVKDKRFIFKNSHLKSLFKPFAYFAIFVIVIYQSILDHMGNTSRITTRDATLELNSCDRVLALQVWSLTPLNLNCYLIITPLYPNMF